MKDKKLVHHLKSFQIKSTPIKIKLRIIGAAEAAANLLCEFNIAEKKRISLQTLKRKGYSG